MVAHRPRSQPADAAMRAHDDLIVVRAQDVVPRDARGVVPEVGQQAPPGHGPCMWAGLWPNRARRPRPQTTGRRARLDGHDIMDDAEAVVGLVLDRQADELALPPVVIRPSRACFPARGPPSHGMAAEGMRSDGQRSRARADRPVRHRASHQQ
jgi:hypothetical protein